ncbi:hypothetical protein [Synechococcus sp. M16CYN]
MDRPKQFLLSRRVRCESVRDNLATCVKGPSVALPCYALLVKDVKPDP